MCLIEPAKTRHICTKYTRSENGNFLVQYLPQTSSVNFMCILNILSIYQINFSSTAVFNEKVKVQKISQILCADMPCFHRPGHNIHPWKSVYLYVFMYRTIKKLAVKKPLTNYNNLPSLSSILLIPQHSLCKRTSICQRFSTKLPTILIH